MTTIERPNAIGLLNSYPSAFSDLPPSHRVVLALLENNPSPWGVLVHRVVDMAVKRHELVPESLPRELATVVDDLLAYGLIYFDGDVFGLTSTASQNLIDWTDFAELRGAVDRAVS